MLLNNTERIILEEFLKDYSNEIYGRAIAKKFKLNQKTVSNALNDLEKQNILKFRTEGKNKYYFINKSNPVIKEIIQLAELSRKLHFLNKHKQLKNLFDKIEGKTDGILVIFGSYAKGEENKDSDLDLLVIGQIQSIKNLEDSFNIDINVVKSRKDKFNIYEPFIKEVMENHIILKGVEDFVNLAWSQ